MLVEAIAGIDIALWDIMAHRRPADVDSCGVGRRRLPAYASSIVVEDIEPTRASAERLMTSRFPP
jgi:L-alanine-DL-glutamate epimerase-like enolase superfamily enzyme